MCFFPRDESLRLTKALKQADKSISVYLVYVKLNCKSERICKGWGATYTIAEISDAIDFQTDVVNLSGSHRHFTQSFLPINITILTRRPIIFTKINALASTCR